MKASNIKFVYFVNPVQVRMKHTVKPVHTVSSDRFTLSVNSNFLTIVVDDLTTLVPMTNISSIMLSEENDTE